MLTVVGAASGAASVAYRSASAHAAIGTAAGTALLLAAYLTLGRFRHRGAVSDLLLATALGVLGVTNIAENFGYAAGAGHEQTVQFLTPASWRLAGTVMLVAAATGSTRAVREHRRYRAIAAGAVTVALVAVTLLVRELLHGTSAAHPAFAPAVFNPLDPPLAATLRLAAAAFAGVAAGAFARRAVREGHELLKWLSVACAVFGFGRLNDALFPTQGADWIYTGDVLRLVFGGVVLGAAAREIARLQRLHAQQEAVREERRRLARDLHDGVAQDLAYVVLQAQLARDHPDPQRLDEIAQAAEHALTSSRRAITALANDDRTLGSAVIAAAAEVARREGVHLDLDVPVELDASKELREALPQIAREAVQNAARHGPAKQVVVALRRDPTLRLLVGDDGRGFDPTDVAASGVGYGLTSMRERAELIGGVLRIRSERGAGTVIEVIVS